MTILYLDNGATSFPKPEKVYAVHDKALREWAGNPGRSGHALSIAAGKCLDETRFYLARLFNAEAPQTISFAFNTTDALNIAIKGALNPGDHVITGSMEHNSVLRPLYALEQAGLITVTRLPCSPVSGMDAAAVKDALKPNTRLVVCSHVSNVTGTAFPVAEIGRVCRAAGALFAVDAAQSAGSRPIDVQAMCIDLLAFPGHKGLLGPQGTGGLYVRPGVTLKPLKEGGAGILSAEPEMPPQGPERYEAGTQNVAGIAALGEGARAIIDIGVDAIMTHEAKLANRIIEGLSALPKAILYGPPASNDRSGVVSFNIEGMDPQDVALALDTGFDIAVRPGLHCAPDTHALLGTLNSGGTVRVSPGFFNTESDIDIFLHAVEEISA